MQTITIRERRSLLPPHVLPWYARVPFPLDAKRLQITAEIFPAFYGSVEGEVVQDNRRTFLNKIGCGLF